MLTAWAKFHAVTPRSTHNAEPAAAMSWGVHLYGLVHHEAGGRNLEVSANPVGQAFQKTGSRRVKATCPFQWHHTHACRPSPCKVASNCLYDVKTIPIGAGILAGQRPCTMRVQSTIRVLANTSLQDLLEGCALSFLSTLAHDLLIRWWYLKLPWCNDSHTIASFITDGCQCSLSPSPRFLVGLADGACHPCMLKNSSMCTSTHTGIFGVVLMLTRT